MSAETACEEECGDGKDNDCDGEIDEGCAVAVENKFELYPKNLRFNLSAGQTRKYTLC